MNPRLAGESTEYLFRNSANAFARPSLSRRKLPQSTTRSRSDPAGFDLVFAIADVLMKAPCAEMVLLNLPITNEIIVSLMGVRVDNRQAVHPANPTMPIGADMAEYFYPNEAVRVLGVEHAEYRQLRALLALVRDLPEAELGNRWTRYGLADIAGLQVAIRLVGGPDAFRPGRRLRLAPLRAALTSLRKMGVTHPLIEVPLILVDGKVVAQVKGLIVDPVSGQGLLGHAHDLLRQSLIQGEQGPASIRRLQNELALLRREQRANVGQHRKLGGSSEVQLS